MVPGYSICFFLGSFSFRSCSHSLWLGSSTRYMRLVKRCTASVCNFSRLLYHSLRWLVVCNEVYFVCVLVTCRWCVLCPYEFIRFFRSSTTTSQIGSLNSVRFALTVRHCTVAIVNQARALTESIASEDQSIASHSENLTGKHFSLLF